mgnify:CR=1 FL=1
MSTEAADRAAREAYERDQQARMREAHEFRTSQEREAYNGRIAWERQQAEERAQREREQQRQG